MWNICYICICSTQFWTTVALTKLRDMDKIALFWWTFLLTQWQSSPNKLMLYSIVPNKWNKIFWNKNPFQQCWIGRVDSLLLFTKLYVSYVQKAQNHLKLLNSDESSWRCHVWSQFEHIAGSFALAQCFWISKIYLEGRHMLFLITSCFKFLFSFPRSLDIASGVNPIFNGEIDNMSCSTLVC